MKNINKQSGFAPLLVVVIVAVIAVGGYFVYRSSTRVAVAPTPTITPMETVVATKTPTASATPLSVPSEAKIIEALVTQWSTFEKTITLKATGSGHWYGPDTIQFIASDTLLISYEDGHVNPSAVIKYTGGTFKVLKSYYPPQDSLSQWNAIVATYGNSKYPASNYESYPTGEFVYKKFTKTSQNLFVTQTPTLVNTVKIALITALPIDPNVMTPISGTRYLYYIPRTITPTTQPLNAAFRELFSSGVSVQYRGVPFANYIAGSLLAFENATIVNGTAKIYFKGQYNSVGDLDCPLAAQQIELTAKQFSSVQKVETYINGQLLDWNNECSLR